MLKYVVRAPREITTYPRLSLTIAAVVIKKAPIKIRKLDGFFFIKTRIPNINGTNAICSDIVAKALLWIRLNAIQVKIPDIVP